MKHAQRRIGLVGGLTIVGLVVVGTSLLIGSRAHAEAGTYADWLTAVSTLMAVLAAVHAGFQTARALKIERDRDEERARDARMEQARQVAVWALPEAIRWRGPRVTHTASGAGPVVTTRGDEPFTPESITLSVRNLSRLPVFRLTVDLYVGAEMKLACRCPVQAVILDELDRVEIMSPELSLEAGQVVAGLAEHDADQPPALGLGWTFTDVTGIRWTRTPGGQLTPAAGS